MTESQVPVQQGSGNVPVQLGDYQFASTGLEDFKASDSVLPRIKIVQQEGLWQDNLTNSKFPTLRFVVLGLVKQRVLFHHNVEDNDVPMCKSSDFETGYPNPDAPRQKSFPWQLSGFNPGDFPPDAEGNIKLPCAGCQLKEWGSNPTGETPYCAEQFTLPIYYDTSQDLSGAFAPAILTLQKSSIKPIRQFLTSFAQSGNPPFITIGQATLKTGQRGSVIYSVPTFIKEGESDRSKWMEYSEQYADMRKFLQRPPVRDEENGDGSAPVQQQAPQDNSWGQPPAAAPQDPWQAQAPAPPAADPWATPQEPVAQQPVQQAPVQPVQTQQAPPPPASNVVPMQQPVQTQQAPPPPAPPVQQAPAPTPPPPAPPVQQMQEPVTQQVPVEQPPVETPPPAPVQPETPQQPAAEPVAQQPVQQPPAAPPAPAGNDLPF